MSTVEISLLYLQSVCKLLFVEWSWMLSCHVMTKFTSTLCLSVMHLTYSMELACSEWGRDWMFLIHLNLMVRDLFIWLFVVGGAVSTYASSVDVLKWTYVIRFSVRVSVNASFDGRPENINTISALPRLKTSTTCTCQINSYFIFSKMTCELVLTYSWMVNVTDWLTDMDLSKFKNSELNKQKWISD